MHVRETFLSALAACFGLALFMASCATPSTTTCPQGQSSCNGVCTDITTTQNCGACGKVCGSGAACMNGTCQCGAGLLNCNGACVPSNSSNCGQCGVTCSGTQVCNNNQCSSMCTPPAIQCSGGACANTASDNANCGTCGNVCSGGSSCVNSQCVCSGGVPRCGTICCGSGQTCTNNQCVTPTGTGGTSGGGGTGGTGGGSAGTTGATGGSAVGGTGGAVGNAGRGGGAGGTAGTGGGSGGAMGTAGDRGSCAIMPQPGVMAADVISDFEEGYGVMIKQGGRTGYWSPYNNSADPQNQTPTKPAAAMADKIAVMPGGACAGNAFVSSATGQDNYVGFGAKFHPNMPLTTSELGDAYNVSAYDGITFRARTMGGPASQPVFVEILTKETQPTTAGGTATVQAIDLYNNRGFMANVDSSTYKTFYVPFGALIPRSLPAAGSGGNACAASGGPSCQAPKFVPASALAIQFSFYGPMDTPGFLRPTTVGSYNMAIDDVAFYKRANLPAGTTDLPPVPSSTVVTAANAFPRNLTPGNGCFKAQGSDGRLITLAYQNWKDKFVRAADGGYRVVRPAAETGSGEDTVSEGIAYAMLISAYMNDKTYFDGFWTYWKAHCAVGSGNSCLMTWKIGGSGGSGTATDADEDAAFALLVAAKMWGGSYMDAATAMMAAVMSADMSTSAPYVWGGNNYKSQGNTIHNASYYAPAFYRAFATASGNSAWNTIANGVYTQLANANAISSNGLISAWCNSSCSATATNSGSADPATDVIYQYDSHRIPWRIGMDYCWNGTAAAKTYVDKTTAFFMNMSRGGGGMGRIGDLYQPNGTAYTGAAANSASAIGTAAAGGMVNSQQFVNDGYQLVLDLLNRGPIGDRLAAEANPPVKSGYSYYNATVGLLMLLTMSGNFTLL